MKEFKLKSFKIQEDADMEQYKQEFIEFMVDCNVLKFGEFTLKSGRKSRNTTQRPFMTSMEMILTCFSDRRTKEFLSVW